MVFKSLKLQWNHFRYIKKKTPHFLTPKKHKIKNTTASHHPEFKKRSITVFCVWRSSFCVLNAAASKHILVTRISRRQDTEERKANGAIWGITGRGFIWRTTQQVEISDSRGGWGGWGRSGTGLCGPSQSPLFLCLRLDSPVSTVKKWARCRCSWCFDAALLQSLSRLAS